MEVNKALTATRVLIYIRIQRLSYKEKGNYSGLMGTTATSSMILSQHHELLFRAARKFNPKILDATEDQRWHHLWVHSLDLDRYSQQ